MEFDPTQREIKEAEKWGGYEDPKDYRPFTDNKHYSDKGGHQIRSVENDDNGQHQRHWQKEERKQ
jgi:hypothetical protein